MCQAKPGRRCAHHTRQEIHILHKRIEESKSEVEARWKANHPGEDYSPQKGLAHTPALEYSLRNLEDSLEKAEIAYVATDTGSKEAASTLESIRATGTSDVNARKRLEDLQAQVNRAALQNGLRDSAVQQIKDFTEATESAPASESVRMVDKETEIKRNQMSPRFFLEDLEARKNVADQNIDITKRDLARAVNAVETDIVNGRTPEKSMEEWRNRFLQAQEAQAVGDKVTKHFAAELGVQRERRRAEKVALGQSNTPQYSVVTPPGSARPVQA